MFIYFMKDISEKGDSMSVDKQKIEVAVKMILEAIGENPEREGLLDTPARVARMYEEVFSGLHEDPQQHLKTYFSEPYDNYVFISDIPFYSMCEHHLLPFFGRVHVAYYPGDDAVVGLSKIPRVVDCIAKRPQLQERMSKQIAEAIEEAIPTAGVFVMIEAEHMCMSMRGIKVQGSKTKTIYSTGRFKEEAAIRAELLSLLK